eukprot:scaffold96419_cov32-Tisochrysis_lutea.AAC.1
MQCREGAPGRVGVEGVTRGKSNGRESTKGKGQPPLPATGGKRESLSWGFLGARARHSPNLKQFSKGWASY